jgi:hypothetical protein
MVRTITREIASGRTQLRTQHRRQAVAAGHNEAEVSDQFNFKVTLPPTFVLWDL